MTFRKTQDGWSPRAIGLAAWLLMSSCAARGAADAPAARAAFGIAGDEQNLVVLRADPSGTTILQRAPTGAFRRLPPLTAPGTRAALVGDDLYVFLDDGQLYAHPLDGWRRESDLPDRALPLDLAVADGALLALAPSPHSGEIEQAGHADARGAPFDPAGAPLSLLRYDGRQWAAVAACPREATRDGDPRLRPRLGLIDGVLHVAWVEPGAARLRLAAVDIAAGRLGEPVSLALPRAARAFWVARVNSVAMLLVAVGSADDGGERLVGQPLGSRATPAPAMPTEPQLSARGGGAAQFLDVGGFNQHLVALVAADDGASFLQFGLFAAAPAEPTVALRDAFAEPTPLFISTPLFHTLLLALLLGILAILFTVRHGSLTRAAELPADSQPALAFQRLAGALIDLLPISAVTAAIVGVEWGPAAGQLVGWAVFNNPARAAEVQFDTLLWWGYTSVVYAMYCLIMELLTRRTVGKVLSGTRVASARSAPLSALQIVIRNVLRLIELLPPMWILGLLVMLSRNRQRLGDVLAQTVVVRRVEPAPAEGDAADRAASDGDERPGGTA